ncbi:hypothetical protein PHBOTO_003530 [Pseudozyma hubeiensis]|nr:hypothetical protein PHBOTO_003530 [Pseudozyma hubeiensis]
MREPVRRLIDGEWRWCRPETNEVVTLADLLADLDEEPAAAALPANSVNEQPLEDAGAEASNTTAALPIDSVDEQRLADAGATANATADAVPEHRPNEVDEDEEEEAEEDVRSAGRLCPASNKGPRKSLYAMARRSIIKRHFRPCRNCQGGQCTPADFKGRGKRCARCKDVLKKRCNWGDAWLDHDKVRKYADCLDEGMTDEEADVAVWGGSRTILGGELDKMDKKDYRIPISGPDVHTTACCLSSLEDDVALIRGVLADKMSEKNVPIDAEVLEDASRCVARALGAPRSKRPRLGHAVV